MGVLTEFLAVQWLFVIELGEKSMLENFNALAAFGIWFLVMFQVSLVGGIILILLYGCCGALFRRVHEAKSVKGVGLNINSTGIVTVLVCLLLDVYSVVCYYEEIGKYVLKTK